MPLSLLDHALQLADAMRDGGGGGPGGGTLGPAAQ